MKWIPRSGYEQFNGCIWLPRLIEKTRRINEMGGRNYRTGDYIFGESDPLDGALLGFLGISSAQVLSIVREEPDDDKAAQRILEIAGKTDSQCQAFTQGFLEKAKPFLAMIDADEGRLGLGLRSLWLRWIYNRRVMPAAYAAFEAKEKTRPR
jgi:hypothetical protein